MKTITIDLTEKDPTDFLLPFRTKNGEIQWVIPKWAKVTEPTEIIFTSYDLAMTPVQHIVKSQIIMRHQLGGHDLSSLLRFTIKETFKP